MNKVKLGDCIELIIDNRGKTPPLAETGYELIETVSINGSNKYPDYSKITKFVSEETYNTWFRKGHPTSGDILISTVGMNIGDVVIMKSNRGSIAQNLIALRTNNKLNSDYLYYILTSKNIREKIRSLNIGSAQPSLKVPHLLNIEFYLPNIEKQSEISKILNELDEKIEINTQINQTLEQISQTIFKSWFIDFDPVHAKTNALASGQTLGQATQAAMAVISGKNTQELHRLQTANPEQYQQLWEIAEAFPSGFDEEGVPRGWGYEKSENLFDVGIGKTPPRKEPEWFSENSNDIEWISIKDMGNSEVFVNKSSEYLLESAVNKFNVKRIPENTVILSFKLTVGRVGITTKETTTNEAIAHFRLCEKSYLTTEFLYLYLKNFDFNNLGSTSSIATAVNSKTIKEMEILYPTLEIINVFQYRVSDIFKAIRANSEQSNCLEKIRDELLPKLLSGELNGLPEKAI